MARKRKGKLMGKLIEEEKDVKPGLRKSSFKGRRGRRVSRY
jgi:hypothetical protein